MATPKSLGGNPRPNARPVTSVNQRPQQAQPQAPAFGRQPARPMQQPTPQQARRPVQPASQSAAPKQVPSYGATRTMGPAATQRILQSKQQIPQAQQPQQVPQAKADATTNFVNMLRDMVGGFAILSEQVLNQNIELMVGNTMSYEDRTISFECADYVISNLAYIFMGLVLDKNFKDAFLEALNVELQIDSQPESVRAQTRKQMKDPKSYKSTGSLVLGVTTFMPNVSNELMRKMQAGFTKLDAFSDEFDAEVARMTNERKVELGFIFSNFMFLIRAFTHNDMFMSYVITVIEKVKGITSGGQQK